MTVEITCGTCGTRNEVSDALRGQKTECTFCFATLKVPCDETLTTLPGYRVEELLGSGSMGRVYRAIQLSMDREVALKVIPAGSMKRSEDQSRFMNEVRLLARMDHPGIVSAFEAGENEEFYYLSMSYVKGEAVDKRLLRQERIPEDEAVNVALQVARALAYAWDKHHILHRDIKPSNIMIAESGQVKLMDLGISKVLGPERSASVTATGMVVGTPYYMSPEQAVSSQSMDRRSDIYSLGATLYEMLTGHKPFEGDNPLEVMGHHRFTSLISPRSRNPKISRGSEAVLFKMLAKDKNDRYQTWESLIDDLERLREHRLPKHASLDVEQDGFETDPSRTPTKRRIAPLPLTPGAPLMEQPAARKPLPAPAPQPVPARSTTSPLLVVGLTLFALGLLSAATYFAYLSTRRETRPRQNKSGAPQAPPPMQVSDGVIQPPAATEAAIGGWSEAMAAAEAWFAVNPALYDEASSRFHALARQAPNEESAANARAAAEAAQRQKRAAIRAIVETVNSQAETLLRRGKMKPAVSAILDYEGPLAMESANARELQAAELLMGWREQNLSALQEAERLRELLEQLARLTVADKTGEAFARLQEVRAQKPELLNQPEAQRASEQLGVLMDVDRRLRESFREEIGKEIRLVFRDGPRQVVIRGIGETEVDAFKVVREGESVVRVKRPFGTSELDPSEQIRRLGASDDPAIHLAKALVVYHAGRPELALRAIRQLDSLFAHAVAGEISRRSQEDGAHALQAFRDVLLPFAVTIELPVPECVTLIHHASPPTPVVEKLQPRLQRLLLLYGTSPAVTSRQALFDAVWNKVMLWPALQAPLAPGVSAKLAMKALTETLPPKQRGTIELLPIDQGQKLLAADVKGLRTLAPLLGAPLQALEVRQTAISDLSPLRGMPLHSLEASHTGVTDLSPLRGMALHNLGLAHTPAHDLTPLAGLPIRTLDLSYTQVQDLAPLIGSPVEALFLEGCDAITDLQPLLGMTSLHTLVLPPRAATLPGFDKVLGMPSLEQVGFRRGSLQSPDALRDGRGNEKPVPEQD